MKRILVVDFNGTSSVYTHYFSNGLKDENTLVKILGKKKSAFLDVFNSKNEYIGYNTRFKFLNYILNWIWLLFNYKKFDIVVIQWLQLIKYLSVEVYLVKYLQKKIEVNYIVHNLYPHSIDAKRIKKRYQFLYESLHIIVVHTDEIYSEILKLTNKDCKIIKINHGLFFKKFRVKPVSNYAKCLMVGYIKKYKGVEDALKIVAILKRRGVMITLEIIGFGEKKYILKLEEFVKEYGIANQVSIHSKEVTTEFLINKINKSTMLWLPYKNISQSGVSYTSLGLCKPFVAYDVGNFNSAFGNKKVCEIVEESNFEMFAESVTKISNNYSQYTDNILKYYSTNNWELNRKELIKNN